MTSLKSQVESILFLASKPLTLKSLAKIVNAKPEDVKLVLDELAKDYPSGRGIGIAQINDEVQLTTSPDNAPLVEAYLKEEINGELTRPSLETLTVVAYRGPITKPEIEMIRGVNCSLILRNLLLRGLVDEKIDGKTHLAKYSITFDFLHYLGINSIKELPEYDKLSSHEILEQWLLSQSQSVRTDNQVTESKL